MKKALVVLSVFILPLIPAHASLITYEFTATVTFSEDWYSPSKQIEYWPIGSIITGNFSFDPAIPSTFDFMLNGYVIPFNLTAKDNGHPFFIENGVLYRDTSFFAATGYLGQQDGMWYLTEEQFMWGFDYIGQFIHADITSMTPVPEPSTCLLVFLGFILFALLHLTLQR